MSLKFGNKVINASFKFGNKVGSNATLAFGNKINKHGRGANGYEYNPHYDNAGKPKQSDLEKHHNNLSNTHRMQG